MPVPGKKRRARIHSSKETTTTRYLGSGKVADLHKPWQKDAIEMEPDVLSILVGTNDIAAGVESEAYEADYRAIIDASRKVNPELKLVLLDPFVLQSGKLKHEDAWLLRRHTTDALGAVVSRW